jgi:hypothetical protein
MMDGQTYMYRQDENNVSPMNIIQSLVHSPKPLDIKDIFYLILNMDYLMYEMS